MDVPVTGEPREAELSEDVPGGERAGRAGSAEGADHLFSGDAVLVPRVQAQDLGAVLDGQGAELAVGAVYPVDTLHQQAGAAGDIVDGSRADNREVGSGCAPDEV